MDAVVALLDDDIFVNVVANVARINENVLQIVEDMPVIERVREPRQVTRNENYYEVTVPLYTLDEFKEHFRMTRPTMEVLVQAVATNLVLTRNPIVPIEKKVLITVWLLAKPETFLACGDRFGVARSTAHVIFREIVGILTDMVNEYVLWPTARQCADNAEIFRERSGGIPNVIGAIDGTHIFIKQPTGNAFDFYNRHQTHSVVIQAVCDPIKQFIDVSVGHPGRMHDARIFRRSSLYRKITNEETPLISREQHIIGDCAYPLFQELLTPFRNTGHLTPQQIRYNNRFSRIRSIIERAFALLKGKWRRLKYFDMSDMDLINQVITGCCVIHNIIIQQNEEDDEDFEEEGDEEVPPDIEIHERRRHALGEIKRNEIVNLLNQRR